MENNDPNVRFAKRKIRLVYQMWEYKHEAFVTMGGNCRGNGLLEMAHEIYMQELFEKNNGPYTIFFYDEGAKLHVDAFACRDDEDMDGEDAQAEFERDMEQALVLIEIVEVKEE